MPTSSPCRSGSPIRSCWRCWCGHAEAALAARPAGPDRLRGTVERLVLGRLTNGAPTRGRRRRRARHRRADAGAAADRRGRTVPPARRRASARPGAELPRRPRAVAGAGRLSARLCRPERLLQRLQALDRPLAPPLPRRGVTAASSRRQGRGLRRGKAQGRAGRGRCRRAGSRRRACARRRRRARGRGRRRGCRGSGRAGRSGRARARGRPRGCRGRGRRR